MITIKSCFTFFFITIVQFVFSQQLIRESLSCLGSSYISENVLIRQTIGQSSSTEVGCEEYSCIRQGFQQPIENNAEFDDIPNLIINVFPNPAQSSFSVLIPDDETVYTCQITDILGKEIFSLQADFANGIEILCSEWTEGIYFINMYSSKNILAVYKLVKSQ